MKLKLLFFASLLCFLACTSENKETTEQPITTVAPTTPAEPTLTDYDGPITAEAVTGLADQVYNSANKKIDSQKALHYVQACEAYAAANPDDENSPEWLMKAAETARNINQHNRAIKIYDTVIEKFPKFPKVPQAMFLKAFTLDENMNKLEEAKVLYEEFLEKYPEDDFAKDAKFMLKNLYKTDAEIIAEFEKMRKEKE